MHSLQVILVEDDPMVQEVHRQFIEKIDGFTVIGAASDGLKGLELARIRQPDLAIVDIYMPCVSGIEMLKGLRTEGLSIDVIAITAASDIETIHKVLQHGAFDYIMKPFTFERINKSLKNYLMYRLGLKEKINLSQQELDKLLFTSLNNQTENDYGALPKGLNDKTLKKIIEFISNVENNPVSADEVAEGVGLARVTARRYLDYLEKEGKVRIHIQYGGVGRPINRYGKL